MLYWPAPVHHDPPIVIRPPLVPPSVPVLVLGGTLDSLHAPLDGGTVVTREMGASARLIRVVNTTHVTAEVDPFEIRASKLVRAFVGNPGLLFSLKASCASQIPVVRSVGVFPEHVSGEPAAQPLAGNRASKAGLRAVTAAVEFRRAMRSTAPSTWACPGGRAFAEAPSLSKPQQGDPCCSRSSG